MQQIPPVQCTRPETKYSGKNSFSGDDGAELSGMCSHKNTDAAADSIEWAKKEIRICSGSHGRFGYVSRLSKGQRSLPP
jgi:hypothetical protein